jgi:aminoglycoside phosphotransferase (APT) family kinase protein
VSVDVTVKGIAAFLSDVWATPVEVSDVSAASAGARRRNILFTAHRGEDAIPLVATIIHDAGLQIMTVETEAATLQLAEQAGVAVAHVHAVCMDPAYVGGPFFVTSQIPGETIPRQILRLVEATPGLGPTIGRGIGASLAKLHAVDPALAHPLLDRPQYGATTTIAAALQHVRAQIDLLLQPSPVFELTYAWLENNQPQPGEHLTIVQRDCRNGNIIVGADGLRAILDWEVAHLGEPMEDLAWVCVRMWRFRNDDLEVGGFATRDDLRAGYEDAGGTWDEASFFWWKVHATLRWGLGLAGQGRAHLDGTFSSIVMAGSGRRVGELEYDCLMLLRDQFA